MSTPERTSILQLPQLMLVTVMICWATNAIVGKLAADAQIDPLVMSFLRWSCAALFLLPFTGRLVWAHRHTIWQRRKALFLHGCLSVGLYNTLLYTALHSTTAINATLVGSTMPAMTLLMAFCFANEAVTRWKVAGVVLSMSGVLLVITGGDPAVALTLAFGDGDLIMLLATLAWGAYAVSLRRWPPGIPGLAFLSTQIIAGLLLLTPLFVLSLWMGSTLPTGVDTLWMIPYVAIVPSIIAYLLWNRGVAELGAGAATTYINLVPVFTAILAWPILGEAVAWYHVVGLAIILGGIRLASRTTRTDPAPIRSP